MRYRINLQSAFNAPFILVSGPDGKPDGREFFSCLVEPGSVVEVTEKEHPAVHWEPLDASAREQFAKFPPVSAGTVDDLTPLFGPAPEQSGLNRQVAEQAEQIASLTRELENLKRGTPA